MGMTGAYERNLDAKGRLSLPAPLREELGEHVRVFKALDVDALYVFSAEAFDKWVEGLFAGREGHEGFNPRDINDQKLMRAINKRTTSMDVDRRRSYRSFRVSPQAGEPRPRGHGCGQLRPP